MSELNNNILILAAVVVGVLFVIRAVGIGWHKYDLTGKTMLITGAIGIDSALGKDSHSSLSPSGLTALTDKTAQQNNAL